MDFHSLGAIGDVTYIKFCQGRARFGYDGTNYSVQGPLIYGAAGKGPIFVANAAEAGYFHPTTGDLHLLNKLKVTGDVTASAGLISKTGADAKVVISSDRQAILLLEADINSGLETYQPRVEFIQDAGAVSGAVGFNHGDNYLTIENYYAGSSSGIRLRTAGNVRLTIENTGHATFAGDVTASAINCGDFAATGTVSASKGLSGGHTGSLSLTDNHSVDFGDLPGLPRARFQLDGDFHGRGRTVLALSELTGSNKSAVAGVIISSSAATGVYPYGTIWCQY
jgi:hypothetical protein